MLDGFNPFVATVAIQPLKIILCNSTINEMVIVISSQMPYIEDSISLRCEIALQINRWHLLGAKT